MIFNNRDINILHLVMQMMEIRSRFCQFGVVEAKEYDAAQVPANAQPLVYDSNTLDEDGMFTVLSGLGNSGLYYEDFFVRYGTEKTTGNEMIEIAVPVASPEACSSCYDSNCAECAEIGHYQLYIIHRDGTISEETDMDAEECACCNGSVCENNCTCGHGCNEKMPSEAAMMRCRESGARNLCNCECGIEHCFVECGPVNDENCEFNENGRCHCSYNRCCGCDCECDVNEE